MNPEMLLALLRELNSLFEGCERMENKPDDPSGLYTEYVFDSEKFRDKLQKRIDQLEAGLN